VVDYEEDVATETRAINDAALSVHRDDLRPGLVWTPVGHDVLPLEAIARPGKGRLKHTGKLAAVLTEQAQAALAYLRVNATELMPQVGADWLATNDVHLDQPYGTAPADLDAEVVAGAGLAVAVAIASLMAVRPPGPGTVVTGALTPGGELAPVPHVVEKILAADRIQARRIIVPEGDRGRWQAHPTTKVLKTKVVFVGSIAEALRATVEPHRAAPLGLTRATGRQRRGYPVGRHQRWRRDPAGHPHQRQHRLGGGGVRARRASRGRPAHRRRHADPVDPAIPALKYFEAIPKLSAGARELHLSVDSNEPHIR
jgi:hypothetical protein